MDVTSLISGANFSCPIGRAPFAGRVTLVEYIPANAVHAQLRAAWAARTQLRFRVTFTDSGTTVWEFNGFVTGFSQNAAVDTVIEATVGIKITGAIYETT